MRVYQRETWRIYLEDLEAINRERKGAREGSD
jgi:hypothetical protein